VIRMGYYPSAVEFRQPKGWSWSGPIKINALSLGFGKSLRIFPATSTQDLESLGQSKVVDGFHPQTLQSIAEPTTFGTLAVCAQFTSWIHSTLSSRWFSWYALARSPANMLPHVLAIYASIGVSYSFLPFSYAEILCSPPRAHVSEALATRPPVSTQRYVIFNSSSFYPLVKYQ
jgi:hypothetical protein